MKGFKCYGHGGKVGFNFPTKKGFTNSSGKVQQVGGYTRKVPPVHKARGGYVEGPTKMKDGNSVTLRAKPVSEFDDQHGGKGPLRDGYLHGGSVKPPKYAKGGAIKQALTSHVRAPKPAGHGVRSFGSFKSKPLIGK